MKDYFRPDYNFGGLPAEFSTYEKSKYVILPVPYDFTTSYIPGTRRGPASIIDASRNMELYDMELDMEPFLAGIHTLPEIEPVTSGPEEMVRRIEKVYTPLLDDRKCVITLGGEHSITAGIFNALLRRLDSRKTGRKKSLNLSILQLDAHSDLRAQYEGSPFNHACVMRHVAGKLPTVQAGIRSMSIEEAEFARKKKLPIFPAHSYDSSKINNILDHLTEHVYITIDLDVFDPSVIPGVGTPEPGGFDWKTTLQLLEEVVSKKKIAGFDVVELSPLPGQNASEFTACKLVYKMIGFIERYNAFEPV